MKLFGKIYGAALTIALLALAGSAFASTLEKFSLNKKNTYIGFSVRYFMLSCVDGRFDDFKGSFVMDPDHPKNTRADLTIKTASVNTGEPLRDDEIRAPGLFDAAHFPTMTFHSKAIEIGPNNSGHITGDLTLLGVTKPVTLDLVRTPHTPGGISLEDGFRATGKIRRSDFGMDGFMWPVGNVVKLSVCYNMAKCEGESTTWKKPKSKYNP